MFRILSEWDHRPSLQKKRKKKRDKKKILWKSSWFFLTFLWCIFVIQYCTLLWFRWTSMCSSDPLYGKNGLSFIKPRIWNELIWILWRKTIEGFFLQQCYNLQWRGEWIWWNQVQKLEKLVNFTSVKNYSEPNIWRIICYRRLGTHLGAV